MREPANTVLLASAGTGKTYRLTQRYRGLLLDGEDPGEILATTFTRKAAGEILERILQSLAGIKDGTVAPVELERLARRLHSLQVRTLDSWFIHLARICGSELGLPPDWAPAVGEQLTVLHERAVEALLSRRTSKDLLRILEGLHGEGLKRSVRDALLELMEAGLDLQSDALANAWLGLVEPAQNDGNDGNSIANELGKAASSAGDKRLKNALDKLVDAVKDSDWETILTSGFAQRASVGDRTYYNKPIAESVCDSVGAAVKLAWTHFSGRLAQRNAATGEILALLQDWVHRERLRTGTLSFGDPPRLLAQGAAEESVLRHRLDARIQHVLLDEFQDSSILQYRAIVNLIHQAAHSGGVFCVGDMKQAIYAWRSGEPLLMQHFAEWHDLPSPETMEESQRSARGILDTVNDVFSSLVVQSLSLAFGGDGAPHLRAAERFKADFRPHRPHQRLGDPAGRTEARVVAPAEGKRYADLIPRVIDRVAQLRNDLDAVGARSARIGVLVRTNKPIPRILIQLRERGIAASGEGGNPLTDSPAVLAALALLHCADHPGDRTAWFHAVNGPFAGALHLTNEDENASPARRFACALDWRKQLLERGYGPYLAELLRGAMDLDPWERQRMEKLADLGGEWDRRSTLRPSDFVAHARSVKVEDPSAANVVVMTVHASKGLEFDAVVLPLENPRSHGQGLDLWSLREDPRASVHFASHAVSKKIVPHLSGKLRAAWEAAEERDRYEDLCVLYVGMTRARRWLDLVLESPGKDGGHGMAFSLSRIVCCALGVQQQAANELWSKGEEPARVLHECAKERNFLAAGTTPLTPPHLSLRTSARPRVLARTSATRIARETRNLARLATSDSQGDARPRGIAIHRLFEQIEWLEDFNATDEALLAALAGLEDPPAEAQAREWIGEFRKLFASPRVTAALSRPAGVPREHLTLWRERRFALRMKDADGRETLLRGSFDRVVITGPPNAPTSSLVLDFKTGEVADEAAEQAKRSTYEPQMKVYRQALAEMLNLPLTAVRSELVFVDCSRS